MKLLNVDSLEEAREKIWKNFGTLSIKTEEIIFTRDCEPDSIAGSIIAEDIYSEENIPGFRRSIVDGYAIQAQDSFGAGEAIPVFLKYIGEVEMGSSPAFKIERGQCAYVPTGGMIPNGADAVIMIEYTEAIPSAFRRENITLYDSIAPGSGMAEVGEDIVKGDLLFSKGTEIKPQEIGAMAAAGIKKIKIFSPLRASIISTGDELVPYNNEISSGEVRDINTLSLRSLAKKKGYKVISSSVYPDNEELLEDILRKALAESDVIIISGGSSQGEKDMTASLIDKVSSPGVFTHGLALKPGKPSILAWDNETNTLIAGLPGHPVAAIMVFDLLLGWLADKMFNRPPPFLIPAKLISNVPGDPGRAVCQPVKLFLKDGEYFAEPVFGKSGMITTLTKADGFFYMGLNSEGIQIDKQVLVNLF